MNIKTNGLFDEKLAKLLAEIAKTNGFTNCKVKKVTDSENGDGCMGIIESVVITDKCAPIKNLNAIVKSAPKSVCLRNIIEFKNFYKRELLMYDVVLPTFRKIEAEKGLPVSTFAPLLYGCLLDDKSETLVLEDLRSVNYKMYEKRIPMTAYHLRLVLTEMGRFHALSRALRDQKPNVHLLPTGLNDPLVSMLANSDMIKAIIRQCRKVQKAFEKDNAIDLIPYKLFIENMFTWTRNLHECVDEHSVILHGDCWTNNMMFKYEDETNPSKPTSVRFFDYQVARMGSPVIDISYFFYSCCSKEALSSLDDYLHVYYESFSDYLRQLGSDPNKVYPYSAFAKDWQKFSRYGLMMSILQIHIMLTEKDEVVDAAELSETENSLANWFNYEIRCSDLYYERVKPIIKHFIERKFI